MRRNGLTDSAEGFAVYRRSGTVVPGRVKPWADKGRVPETLQLRSEVRRRYQQLQLPVTVDVLP
jgi:hypothetical protein